MTKRVIDNGWGESQEYARYIFVRELGGGICTANYPLKGESENDFLVRTIVVVVIEYLASRDKPLDNKAHNFGMALLIRIAKGYHILGMTVVDRDALRAVMLAPMNGIERDVWRPLYEACMELYREVWYFRAD